jgi:3-deoxy-D-arabino-heptulosonate 7-phosphate (DAHP) synthase class II
MVTYPPPRPAATIGPDGRPGRAQPERSDPREQVAHFTDPLTRMLLASDGFTTPVLEALLGTRLQVRVLRQDLVAAADIPADVAGLLRLDGRGEVLVRRSCMVDPDLSLVSLNQVYAVAPATDSRVFGDITSLHTPIGYSLLGRGVSQRRQIVHIGRSTWRYGGVSAPCAVKAYVMLIDDEPWCYIRECFNPKHVPAAVTAAGPAAVTAPATNGAGERADGPALAGPGSRWAVAQQPPWPDATGVDACAGRLRDLPSLVSPGECGELTDHLAGTVTGDALALHLGDCAETFAGCTPGHIQSRQALLTVGAALLGLGTGRPIVAVGRIAGQYAKPRSRPTEPQPGGPPGAEIPSYFGDMVNGHEPTAAARTPDPRRMLAAYFHAAATCNYLRAHPAPSARAVSEITTAACRALRRRHPSGRPSSGDDRDLIGEIDQLLAAALSAPARSRRLHTLIPPVYTSHEALILPYERALTRRTAAGDWWDCSAHLLWIGDRTCDPRQAHVRFAAQIRNPIAVKLGPAARPEDVATLCALLNPDRIPGRLTLITRLGAGRVHELLPPFLEAADGTPVTWMCDPMHGNTRTTKDGRKFRRLEDITAEVRAFFGVHREHGTVAGGIHLEAAGEPVTECTGGWQRLSETGLDENYQTRCDPRLNPAQTLECLVAALPDLRRQAMADPKHA